jgi:hypothetical protein
VVEGRGEGPIQDADQKANYGKGKIRKIWIGSYAESRRRMSARVVHE